MEVTDLDVVIPVPTVEDKEKVRRDLAEYAVRKAAKAAKAAQRELRRQQAVEAAKLAHANRVAELQESVRLLNASG